MKHCGQCNLDFPEHLRFCASCGEGLHSSNTCLECGEKVDSKWKFCTSCGRTFLTESIHPANPEAPAKSAMPVTTAQVKKTSSPPAALAGAPHREWYASDNEIDDPEEVTRPSMRAPVLLDERPVNRPPLTVFASDDGEHRQPKIRNGPTLSMLSAYGESEHIIKREPQNQYSVFLTLALVLFCGMVGFSGWYLWAHRTSAAAASRGQSQLAGPNGGSSAGDEASAEHATVGNADSEWKHLREKRLNAASSERAGIIAALEQAESKYPSDYRFPYERAKLSIKGITSHDEAFAALADAAAKAIDSGQAQEMRDNLLADKDGDFYKLARGHHEWHALLKALVRGDKSELSHLHH